MSATESPTAGVGASERSMIPNGTPRRRDASCATSCPTRVILNAVFLIVSQSSSKPTPRQELRRTWFTTPGPDTPTLITASASLTPWNAPAMNGLSSGALQRTTSLAHPIESRDFVRSAVFFTISPMRRTASMSMPVFVEPTLTDEHTRSVVAIASGIERMRSSSAGVMPFETTAEYPPMKLMPSLLAARSRVFAILTKSPGFLQHAEPTIAAGVMETRLFTIGTPISRPISSPVFTRFFARRVSFAYILSHVAFSDESAQSRSDMPIVMVLTSRLSSRTILFVSRTSERLIIALHPVHLLEDLALLAADAHAELGA